MPYLMNQKPAITTCFVLWQTCNSLERSIVKLTRCMTNMEFQLQPSCLLRITSSKLMKKLNLESCDFSLFWGGVATHLLLEALLHKHPHGQDHTHLRGQDHADAFSKHASKCNCNHTCRSHVRSNSNPSTLNPLLMLLHQCLFRSSL